MTCRKTAFPFTAIVGQEKMKKALVLNAINPNLSGVLIRGQKGTAKSTAARALANLLPMIEVVEDCPFNCNPHQKNEMCAECLRRIESGEKLPIVKRKMKVVDLPLGATEDRVIGTLDIEHAIKKGEKTFEPGILASAHRGILYIDEVNLLDDHLVDVILDAAAMGVNYVEREGVSFSHPARFILIGTMNPEEGELRPQLLDRFGLCVEVEGIADRDARVEVVQRNIQYENDPHGFEWAWQEEEEKLCQLIVRAKEILSNVTYDKEILALIAHIAIEMAVHGHRADISMLKVAQTIAAYYQRTRVTEDDVKEAAELVLSHRMRRKPFQEPEMDKEKLEEAIQKHKQKKPETNNQRPEEGNQETDDKEERSEEDLKPDSQTEVTFEPGSLYPVKKIPLPKEPGVKASPGRRSKAKSDSKSGRYVRSAIPKEKTNDIAFDATLRASAPYQMYRKNSGVSVAIEPRDIRQKVKEKKIGNVILFVVDSSGSMGANKRMVETKGAILSLLLDAYQKRDRIGLVAFKGDKAEFLLPPTSSVELAKKQLEALPTGGKTPLSKGLLKGYETLKNELNKNKKIKPLLVIISDGKANVSINKNVNPFNEARQIAEDIKHSGIKSIVIDTETGFLRLGRLQELSEAIGGRYYLLEDIRAETITNLVREFIE
ncbi:MAG: putative cobaltochelatase [Thermodesulfovibrionales bacterium]|nr:putative cobaltochelatase [Thermodesulfovibrionales bacterium]